MQALYQDIRYGFRMLLKEPAFAAVAIFTLALGIGGSTAIFSVVDAVLLKRLPYPDASRLVTVVEKQSTEGQMSVAWPNFVDWHDKVNAFEAVAAARQDTFTITGHGPASRISAAQVSPTFFPMLGAAPELGRIFTDAEDEPGSSPVAMLTERYWRTEFGSDASIVGKTILLNGTAYTVVGVLPGELKYFPRAQVYLPIGQFSRLRGMDVRGNHQGIRCLARLRGSATLAQAQAQLDSIMAELEKRYPNSNSGVTATASSLDDYLFHDTRLALFMLLGAVGLVLLIACANVANLFLARATARQREFAIRATLGAGKARLVRQLLTESLLLSAAGGLLGLLLANWSMVPLLHFAPKNVPRLEDTRIDLRVLLFAMGISMSTGVLFGLAPALHALRYDLGGSLKETGATVSSTKSRQRLRSTLLISEVALAIVLVIASGLMVRSILRVLDVKLGANPDHVLALDVYLAGDKYAKAAARTAFFDQALEHVRHLPGVKSAGAVICTPFVSDCWTSVYIVEGRPVPAQSDLPSSLFNVADKEYFDAMQIPLVAGRFFNGSDNPDSNSVVIINESMAKKWWPKENPLGKRVKQGFPQDHTPFMEVVGVVGDVKEEGPDLPQRTEVFLPLSQNVPAAATFLVRTGPEPSAMAKSVVNEIHALDANQAVDAVQPLTEYIESSIAWRKSVAVLLGIFGMVALGLATIGIYGVMSYTVSQRSHEIGIRMALGARPKQILTLVVAQGLETSLIGVGIGVTVALASTQFASGLLFGISPRDPVTFSGLVALVVGVAILGSIVPAWRAAKVDPLVALHHE
jgi:putative ABC transport system permease protein